MPPLPPYINTDTSEVGILLDCKGKLVTKKTNKVVPDVPAY